MHVLRSTPATVTTTTTSTSTTHTANASSAAANTARRPQFTIAMFRTAYVPAAKTSRRPTGPSIVIPAYGYDAAAAAAPAPPRRRKRSHTWTPFATFSNSAPVQQQQVRFDEATLAREREKSRGGGDGGGRSFDEYERGSSRRGKRCRDPALADPRERRHSVSGGSRRASASAAVVEPQLRWPESLYYLGDDTTPPLFLSARERERRGKHVRSRHAEDTAAMAGEYVYAEKRLPAGKGLRRVKSFLWGESRRYS